MIEPDLPVCVLICLDVYLGPQKQNWSEISKNRKFHFVALNCYWDISNDFLMQYVIETDVLVCILICLDVYVSFKDQNLVNNKQKIVDLAP